MNDTIGPKDPFQAARPVRAGVLGTGWRGNMLLQLLTTLDNEVPAVFDPSPEQVAAAQAIVEKAGQPKPEGYSGGDHAWKQLLERDDLDAVVIATTWESHAAMAVQAMKAGKYVALEVPAAITLQECWDLVDTHEETGVPCMMLENWSFRRDNLAILKMIRQGLFGEIVHCHCAHSHNCIFWYFHEDGTPRWSGEHLLRRNADQYPTHSLGPVLSWMDINCGDAFASVSSFATRSLGINRHFAKKFGPDHPAAKRAYCQGDIVTSVVRTHKGNTIAINNDMQLPRPYDNRWMIQGTDGVYSEAQPAIYLHGVSPKNEEWEPFAPYQDKFDHSWWKDDARAASEQIGHGGVDYIELREFLRAVRTGTQPPVDVYDSVVMSVVIPLSEQSIAQGGAPVPCPDFTRGKWKTRKPVFAVEG
jgi:predicted dehydrogenase